MLTQSSRRDVVQNSPRPHRKHPVTSLPKAPNKEKAKLRLASYNFLLENTSLHAQSCLSQIDDPLWKRLCYDVEKMMGAFAVLKIWNCRLGALSLQGETVDLYCQTEETVLFIREYGFLIVGWLQQYFPAIKALSIKMEVCQSALKIGFCRICEG